MRVSRIGFVLDDYLEAKKEEGKTILREDFDELDLIRKGERDLERSYLFEEIEPYVLAFIERKSFKDGNYIGL